EDFEICVISTTGDRITDRTLRDAGGKGLFTKEIEDALIAGDIDLAVHSMKDVPTVLPGGLEISTLLPREDVRDAFVSLSAASIGKLPAGAVIGTASLRRQAQVKRLRPDLNVTPLRGNVGTRLKKLGEGQIDATLLAFAGLRRLGMADRVTALLEPEEMLPAVAQGAIGIEIRQDDTATRGLLSPVNDAATANCVSCERAFLAVLDGSCRTPIAGLARISGNKMTFRGQILTPDGTECHEAERQGSVSQAEALGASAGRELLDKAGPDFFKALG
ncbi:MAG: hydroxymethylbilane synthase, partial [Pseudomonadota bacterium]|nr:hydroxymethylbilane synthase [Pseudomonadota bacterium]